jgi:hypothetical protein
MERPKRPHSGSCSEEEARAPVVRSGVQRLPGQALGSDRSQEDGRVVLDEHDVGFRDTGQPHGERRVVVSLGDAQATGVWQLRYLEQLTDHVGGRICDLEHRGSFPAASPSSDPHDAPRPRWAVKHLHRKDDLPPYAGYGLLDGCADVVERAPRLDLRHHLA